MTYGLLAKGAGEITDRLLKDAGLDATRWSQLVDSYANVPNDRRVPLLEGLSGAVAQIRDASAQLKLRGALRRFLHHHRAYPDAKWRLPDEELTRMDEIYNSLEPIDPIDKYGWLFSSQGNELPRPSGKGWERDEALVYQCQQEAVRALLETGYEEDIFRFAESVQSPAQFGLVLSQM